jgi:GNAT superfamily N-acetyltransferase
MISATDNQRIELDLPNGIRVTASDDPASPVLTRFFAGYDRAFVLPDEREELDGFKACLALNATHRHAYGRIHSELVVTFEDADRTLLGGANFLATAIDRGAPLPPAAIALNYVFVEEAVRGRGLLRIILATVRDLARIALGLDRAGPPPAIFIEQNDPLRLTAEEYAADTAHSGTDQIDRLTIWARVGTRVVDFPYIQPALSAAQQPDDGLIYAAVDYPGDAVDPGLLHDHLESFFGISVLKGATDVPDAVAATQVAALAARRDPVALLPMEPALAWLRAGERTDDFDSFRALAEATKKDGEQ